MSLAVAAHVRVERVTTDGALAAVRADWNQLARGMPFRRHEWLATWWKHYRTPQDELFLLSVYAAGRLVGLAPWYLSTSSSEGRVVRFLGSGEVCTDYQTLLAAEGQERQVAVAIADWLAARAFNDWERLELTGVAADDPAINAMVDRLVEHDVDVHARPGMNCWRIDFPGSWHEYLASISKSRRERVRKFERRYFVTGRVQTGMVENPDELEPHFRQLIDLHQRRRTTLGQPGCFSSPRFTAYHREVTRQMFEAGLLRLWWTKLDGQPAAIEYDLACNDTVYFYQSGIEPALAEHRPGWLGAIGSFREAVAGGYRGFDFLRGDEPYKASWGAKVQPMVEWRIVAPHSLPRIRHAAWSAGQSVRRLARSGLDSVRRWALIVGQQREATT